MDLTESIAPRSDQLNAEDFLSGPRTVTITEVHAGNAEQPVNVHVAEFPDRPFKPSKSMRRVMVAAWGKDSTAYAGRRMTLYRDPTVRFGGQDVGGIRISHMTDLKDGKRLTIALTVTRGKRAPYVVEPLAEPALRARAGQGDGATFEQQVEEAVTWFTGRFSVTRDQLEHRTGHTTQEWTREDLAFLRDLAGALNRGEKRVDDEFPQQQVTVAEVSQGGEPS